MTTTFTKDNIIIQMIQVVKEKITCGREILPRD